MDALTCLTPRLAALPYLGLYGPLIRAGIRVRAASHVSILSGQRCNRRFPNSTRRIAGTVFGGRKPGGKVIANRTRIRLIGLDAKVYKSWLCRGRSICTMLFRYLAPRSSGWFERSSWFGPDVQRRTSSQRVVSQARPCQFLDP